MSIRNDLPIVPQNIINAAVHASVRAAGTGDAPRAVLEAVEAVGAQVKEHRTGIDSRIDGVQADLQHLQQIVAQNGLNGGGSMSARSLQTVSAQVLADSDTDLENLRSGRTKSVRMSLPTFHTGPSAAAITSGGARTPAERDAEIYGVMPRPTSVRDLLVTRSTSSNAIEYLRGTRTGAAAIQAAEGDQKAELELAFTLESAAVKTIACWVPASRQALDDATMLRDYIDLELSDALKLTEDAQLLKGNGAGANILGLMTSASAYNRGKAGDGPSDTIRRAITQVQLARGEVTGIVINPQGLERLELEKDGEGRYLFAYAVTDANGGATVWRVPAVVTDAMEATEFMVGDFNRAARLYDRMQATIEIATTHADFFTRNLVAILAEERVALTINRPDLLVIGNFPAAN